MKILITCGPSYTPIDRMRRITNASTGKLGTQLAAHFLALGYEVICLRGEAATHPEEPRVHELRTFGTNEDIVRLFDKYARIGKFDAILHAAALCDFEVKKILDPHGNEVEAGKLPSSMGGYDLSLKTAPKVLVTLRKKFPQSFIVGWKYEIDGTHNQSLDLGLRQMKECQTNLCVVNGPAYGTGYGVLHPDQTLIHRTSPEQLAEVLAAALRHHAATHR